MIAFLATASSRATSALPFPQLTEREREVMELLAGVAKARDAGLGAPSP